MKKTAIGWFIYLLGLASLLAVDYFVRIADGDVKTGGIPEVLGMLFILMVSGWATYLLYKGTESLMSKPFSKKMLYGFRFLIVGLQVGIGWFISAVTGILYICNAGIDCF